MEHGVTFRRNSYLAVDGCFGVSQGGDELTRKPGNEQHELTLERQERALDGMRARCAALRLLENEREPVRRADDGTGEADLPPPYHRVNRDVRVRVETVDWLEAPPPAYEGEFSFVRVIMSSMQKLKARELSSFLVFF